MAHITDKAIGDVLRDTLEELYGVKVWWNEPGTYHIEAGGKKAVVTWDEIDKVHTSTRGFYDLLKQKLDL
jgi:hypothetical protein